MPLLLLAISMECLLRSVPDTYSYQSAYLDKHSNEIEVLILGNSQSYLGIDPIYFTKNTFNAGNVSQSLDLSIEILNKYKRNLDKLKVIVIPISYSLLWSSLYDSEESWRIRNYVSHYGVKPKILSDFSEVLSNSPINNCERLKNFYIAHKTSIDCSELGWGTIYRTSPKPNNLEESGKQRVLDNTLNIHSEKEKKIFTQNLEILKSFSDICNEKNCKLIFITTPAYHTFRENLNAEQFNKMIETTNRFVEKHSNCYYLNWFEDTDFIADDFFDADHLNEIGAKKLSLKLSNYIDSLTL